MISATEAEKHREGLNEQQEEAKNKRKNTSRN